EDSPPRQASRRPEGNRGFPPATRGKHHRLRGSNRAVRRPRLAARVTTRGISATRTPSIPSAPARDALLKTFRAPFRIASASKRAKPLTYPADLAPRAH